MRFVVVTKERSFVGRLCGVFALVACELEVPPFDECCRESVA